MFCTNCGHEIADNAAICVHCGVEAGKSWKFCAHCGKECSENQAVCIGCGCSLQAGPAAQAAAPADGLVHPSGKSPTTAAILSCLIVGLGQLYLGQVMFLVSYLVGAATGGILTIIIWIAAIIDASNIGKKLEQGKSVGQWEFF